MTQLKPITRVALQVIAKGSGNEAVLAAAILELVSLQSEEQ